MIWHSNFFTDILIPFPWYFSWSLKFFKKFNGNYYFFHRFNIFLIFLKFYYFSSKLSLTKHLSIFFSPSLPSPSPSPLLLLKAFPSVSEMALVLESGCQVRFLTIIAGGDCTQSYSTTFPIKITMFLGLESHPLDFLQASQHSVNHFHLS